MATFTQRLARYGLEDRERGLTELRVTRGTQLHLTLDHPQYCQKTAVLRATTAADLKQWLGVPNGAVAQSRPAPKAQGGFVSRANCYPFVPHVAIPLKDPSLNANLVSYLIHDTTSVNPRDVLPLNNYLKFNPVNVIIYLFADIYIDNHSTLFVDSKIQTLFAGNIYIGHDGGTLEMQCPFASIDCFGIQDFSGLQVFRTAT